MGRSHPAEEGDDARLHPPAGAAVVQEGQCPVEARAVTVPHQEKTTMARISSRRTFVKEVSLVLAAAHAAPWFKIAAAADAGSVVADTSSGKIRGLVVEDIKVFKGVPYGGTTAGTQRFMPPTKPAPWTGVRDAVAYGPTAPQPMGNGRDLPAASEDCLVLNVFTPALGDGRNRPVLVWLHGGGFSTGSGSQRILDGTNLAHTRDAVVGTINHRLNVLGFKIGRASCR